jgi:hypothetical protein
MDEAGGGAYRALAGVLVVLGCLCLAAGSAIALYAGWIVLLILTDPTRVALVAYLIELGQTELHAVRINIENQAIDIELGEPMYWLLLLLVGVLLIGVISGVAKALVAVGIQILRAGLDESRRVRYPPQVQK